MDTILPLVAPLAVIAAFVAAVVRGQYQLTLLARAIDEQEQWNRECRSEMKGLEQRLEALRERLTRLEWEMGRRSP